MTETPAQPMTPEPLESALTGADDRLLLNHWMPPQAGIVPRIRIGQRWVSTLWALPIGAAALDDPDRHRAEPSRASQRQGIHQAVSGHRPGRAIGGLRFSLVVATPAFPEHVLHAVHHPGRDPDPGRPSATLLEARLHAGNRLVSLPGPCVRKGGSGPPRTIPCHIPGWLGIPGVRHSLGLARWWHFSVNLLCGHQRRRSFTCCCFPPTNGAGWCR